MPGGIVAAFPVASCHNRPPPPHPPHPPTPLPPPLTPSPLHPQVFCSTNNVIVLFTVVAIHSLTIHPPAPIPHPPPPIPHPHLTSRSI